MAEHSPSRQDHRPRLLEVDTLEARTRGLFDQQQSNGPAELSGMLAMLIQGLEVEGEERR